MSVMSKTQHPHRGTPCVSSEPIREMLSRRAMSVEQLGRIYGRRYNTVAGGTTVSKLLNEPLIPYAAADKLAVALDSHPILVWGSEEWNNPTYIEGGVSRLARRTKAKKKVAA